MKLLFNSHFFKIKIIAKIVDVAQNLKESTKKLCRLFKENPDLESDALKVKKDRI